MHYSVGAIIQRGNKFLMLDRATDPPGWAGIAGHVDEGEEAIDAILREVPEECGRAVVGTPRLLSAREMPNNPCSHGVDVHFWELYEVEIEPGEVRLEEGKAKAQGWFTAKELAVLELEPIWRTWLTMFEIIPAC